MTSKKKGQKKDDTPLRCACGPGDIWAMTEGAKKDKTLNTAESSGQATERTPDDGATDPALDSEG